MSFGSAVPVVASTKLMPSPGATPVPPSPTQRVGYIRVSGGASRPRWQLGWPESRDADEGTDGLRVELHQAARSILGGRLVERPVQLRDAGHLAGDLLL